MKKVPTMTEQEKQELLDVFMNPTPEQEEARDLQRQKDFDETFQVFIDQHDFMEEPTLQTKQAAAWTRKNIVLDSWNQYINCEAKQAEFFGDYPEGKGFRVLSNTRRCDIALGFAHYFLASMKMQVKMIDEEVAKENESIELTK